MVRKHELGAELTAAGEAFAVRKLERPIDGQATISVSYRSTASDRTRNAMLVFGPSATNEQLFKVGTAIGMNAHVGYAGDWGEVKRGATAPATFEPDELFELTVKLNVKTRECHAKINGTELDVELPADLKQIAYVGVFCKQTSTAFSGVKVEE